MSRDLLRRTAQPPARILGLDLGPRCGAAWMRRGEIIATTWHLPQGGRCGGEGWHEFLSQVEGYRPKTIVYVAYPPSRGGQGAGAERAVLRGVLEGFLQFYAFKHEASLEPISTVALRTYATGHAHAEKGVLEAEARRHLGLRHPTDHESAAAWALRWGLERAGRAQSISQQRRGGRLNGRARPRATS